MNTPVKFELAKLLKEKGFDEDCYRTYSNGEISSFPLLENMREEPILNPLDYKWTNSKIHESVVSAPTIAEVVMWLYEKHGIWIYISDNSLRLGFKYQIQRLKIFGENNFSSEKRFNSPTKAYEAAIEYVLTKIDII